MLRQRPRPANVVATRAEQVASGSALALSRSSVPSHLVDALDRAKGTSSPLQQVARQAAAADPRQLTRTAFALSLDWRGTKDLSQQDALRLDSLGLEYGRIPRPGDLQTLRDLQARLAALPPLPPGSDEASLLGRLAPANPTFAEPAKRDFPEAVMKALEKHRRLYESAPRQVQPLPVAVEA
ncbi:MAG: hypothetical protein EOO40_06695 [Deltaproteobacteria bacterium]|nr:MAG: hypothetical protein EOO40_06695 [Deltaproteobacteria bacterium]